MIRFLQLRPMGFDQDERILLFLQVFKHITKVGDLLYLSLAKFSYASVKNSFE